MPKLAIVVTLIVAVVLIVALDAQRGDRVPTDQAALTRGAAVYVHEGCAKCHHLAGRGGNMAHPLDGVGTKLTGKQIRAILVDPPNGMPTYKSLSRANLTNLTAYIFSLKSLDTPF